MRKLAQDLPVAHLQPAETEEDCARNVGATTAFVAAASFAAAALGVFAYRRWARGGRAGRATRVTRGSSVETFALKSPYGFLDTVADSIRGPM